MERDAGKSFRLLIIGFAILLGLLFIPIALGFYRYYLLFYQLGIYFSPARVFSPYMLYGTGVTQLFLGLLLPLGCFFGGFCVGRSQMAKISSALFFFSVPLLMVLLKQRLPLTIQTNLVNYPVLAGELFFFLGVYFLGFKWSWLEYFVSFRNFALGFFLVFAVMSSFFSGVDMERQIISGGFPVAWCSVNPGSSGRLITCMPICGASEENDAYGSGAYETTGFLLNKNDKSYYFVPRGSGSNGYFGAEVAVVPEKLVLLYVQDRLNTAPPSSETDTAKSSYSRETRKLEVKQYRRSFAKNFCNFIVYVSVFIVGGLTHD